MPKNSKEVNELSVAMDTGVAMDMSDSFNEDDDYSEDPGLSELSAEEFEIDISDMENAKDPEVAPDGQWELTIARAIPGHTRTEEEAAKSEWDASNTPGAPRLALSYKITNGRLYDESLIYNYVNDLAWQYLSIPCKKTKALMLAYDRKCEYDTALRLVEGGATCEAYQRLAVKWQKFSKAFKVEYNTLIREFGKLSYFSTTDQVADFFVGLKARAVLGVRKEKDGTKVNRIVEWIGIG